MFDDANTLYDNKSDTNRMMKAFGKLSILRDNLYTHIPDDFLEEEPEGDDFEPIYDDEPEADEADEEIFYEDDPEHFGMYDEDHQ